MSKRRYFIELRVDHDILSSNDDRNHRMGALLRITREQLERQAKQLMGEGKDVKVRARIYEVKRMVNALMNKKEPE